MFPELKRMCVSLVQTQMIALFCALAVAQPQPTELGVRHIVALEYPWFARLGVIQGTVELVAPAPLARAAQANLLKWIFTGCTAERVCDAAVVFSFVLNGICSAGEQRCNSTEFEADLPGKVSVKSTRVKAIVN